MLVASKGLLAARYGYDLELSVQKCELGYFIGTADENGPATRESEEFWPTQEQAQAALNGEEGINWVQRLKG